MVSVASWNQRILTTTDHDKSLNPVSVHVQNMATTPEDRTLNRHTDDLQLVACGDIITLSASLVAAAIITQKQQQDILPSDGNGPPSVRAAKLVGFIQSKVRQNREHYTSFIAVLAKNEKQYGDILNKLQETHSVEVSKGPGM